MRRQDMKDEKKYELSYTSWCDHADPVPFSIPTDFAGVWSLLPSREIASLLANPKYSQRLKGNQPMKKGKVFFHPIEGSASLTISWTLGPKGDAVEAQKGGGVGFFSENGDLLSVIFDEVQAVQDHQILEFKKYRIEITVKNGKVTYILTENKATSRKKKSKPSRLRRQSTIKLKTR